MSESKPISGASPRAKESRFLVHGPLPHMVQTMKDNLAELL